MKDIKDYLHLYIGCEAEYTGYHQQWRGINNAFTLMGFNDEEYTIKLLLRPLSDMTEEEEAEMIATQDDVKLDGYPEILLKADSGETVRYMLSKGFDLFGLIEDGLAIDKTTLTVNQ